MSRLCFYVEIHKNQLPGLQSRWCQASNWSQKSFMYHLHSLYILLSSFQPSDGLIECFRTIHRWSSLIFKIDKKNPLKKETQITRKDWKYMKKELIYLMCLNTCQYINQDTSLKSYFWQIRKSTHNILPCFQFGCLLYW